MVIYRRANRQYVAMSEDEVWRFLENQNKVFVAFTMDDGYPHVSPIWFCVDDHKIYLRTHDYKIKAHLAETGKTCLSTDEGYLYRELRGLIIWGRSRLIKDEDSLKRINAKLDRKYEKQQWKLGDMPAKWVAQREREKRAFIEVVPERVDSWDNGKV